MPRTPLDFRTLSRPLLGGSLQKLGFIESSPRSYFRPRIEDLRALAGAGSGAAHPGRVRERSGAGPPRHGPGGAVGAGDPRNHGRERLHRLAALAGDCPTGGGVEGRENRPVERAGAARARDPRGRGIRERRERAIRYQSGVRSFSPDLFAQTVSWPTVVEDRTLEQILTKRHSTDMPPIAAHDESA